MTPLVSLRRRRFLAAITAMLLCNSVLVITASSAVQAANTAQEALVDTDNDGIPDAREFGGRDRYDTALRLAKNFAESKGGVGTVPVAFVASGVTLVDAVSVSGLAGHESAPVLLTPRRSLHNGVADFIEDNAVDTVYVLGGSTAVADSVLDAIGALPNKPEVSRIQGADRYATAAEIASTLGAGAAWCGGDEPAAILVNGGDVSLAYAMMVGPIAYRLKVPVLMTERTRLPSATADLLRSEDIEHVVIVGGTGSITSGVESDLIEAGVDTVQRISGTTAASTSVELAKLAHGGCADDLAPVSGDTVALVEQDALPDGVAAAPVLASTYAGGALVPILLVGKTLPTPVRDYLAATAEEDSDGNKLDLKIVAVGGRAAVSSSVVDAAVAAAASVASTDALSVQIGASTDANGDGRIDADDVPAPGDTTVILYFSGPIAVDSISAASIVRDIVELNGIPARLADGDAVSFVQANDPCEPDEATVSFAQPLRPRDLISIAPGITIGSGTDERRIQSSSVEVTAPAVVRTRPTVHVFMIAGRFEAEVTLSDGGPLNEEDVELRTSNENNTLSVHPTTGNLIFTDALKVGDRVLVRRGAIEDANGNQSPQRSFAAFAPRRSPRIISVLMSNPNHRGVPAAEVPSAIAGFGNDILISARPDGAAAGAAGNSWQLIFDVASTWTGNGDADIDVSVSTADQTVFVRFNDGTARNRDLQRALEANSSFDSLFEVEPPPDYSGACGAIRNKELSLGTNDRQITTPLTGGVTDVAIEVRFDGDVQTVDHDGLLEDILADVVKRTGAADTDAVRDALDLASQSPFEGPATIVRYEARTSNAAMLPQVRDLVTTLAGRDRVLDNPGTDADESAEPVAPIATGYAQPENDEEKNARSQVRIARSSHVEPPA